MSERKTTSARCNTAEIFPNYAIAVHAVSYIQITAIPANIIIIIPDFAYRWQFWNILELDCSGNISAYVQWQLVLLSIIVKWSSGITCNWCVSLGIALVLALKSTNSK